MVVAQLAEQLIPVPEDRGYFFAVNCIEKNIEKEPDYGHMKTPDSMNKNCLIKLR